MMAAVIKLMSDGMAGTRSMTLDGGDMGMMMMMERGGDNDN